VETQNIPIKVIHQMATVNNKASVNKTAAHLIFGMTVLIVRNVCDETDSMSLGVFGIEINVASGSGNDVANRYLASNQIKAELRCIRSFEGNLGELAARSRLPWNPQIDSLMLVNL